MKKSLFALAAVGAFAGAAQAQSSVTVYGILDMGYVGTNSRNVAAANTKTNSASFGQSAETTSRLGFRGTEDLGGGMSAFFTAEFQLFPQEQNLSGNANSGIFNRQTFIGLSKKGLGQFAVGTQYTPIHVAVGATDPGQQNNLPGSIIYPTSSATDTTTSAYTVRQNNTLTAKTERMSGFSLSALYTMRNADRTQLATPAETGTAYGNTNATNGGNTNVTGWGVSADFQWQKLYAVAAYQVFKNENNTGYVGLPVATSSASATGGAFVLGTASNNGSNITDAQTYVAATYDFGILKAYANWINRKATNNLDSGDYLKRSGQQIGVRGNITKTIEGWANIGNGRYQAYGASEPTANFNAWQLGSNYWLSKRTNLYAIYGQTQTSSTSSSTATIATSRSANGYGIGVRHTF